MNKDKAVARKHSYHGGLQFDGDANGALERFGTIVATTLEDYGHLVERKALLSYSEASIVSSQYLVRLTLDTGTPEQEDRYERMDRAAGLKTITKPRVSHPQNRLVLSVTPVSPLLDDTEISELMLVVILYRMVDICSTRRVEWLSPSTVLTVEQFMSAFDTLAPNPATRDRKQIFQSLTGQFTGVNLPELDDTVSALHAPTARPIQLTDEQLLSIAFRSEDTPPFDQTAPGAKITEDGERPSDVLRLSSWCMTGVLASVSAPIAVSMAAVNLIRGEDFRLNTQVLVFTFAIVALNASNAFADVADALGM
ncbi:hypothetical protein GS624_04835 [Ruegeria sp. HKCCD5849]|uniref:hypothetical protein n=1 Tax=Ruegeria sp. HKCCA4633 TaxID=2682983 RepID=UPI0014891DFE|nr:MULTISPECIES: hypothetical protein [unclassified Ruegeria]NOD46631.1 hypothetical protein [Ruegeria sp. HKCCD5849]NOD50069.1 hypothetical protein [Ruegeria sp. HKCCD5851]NOD66903.1 hypothetical protein [Ruegeria sp. HKCCD7303]NOE32468.1 hypothetical protein [Ruegeria sp. HKCCD7318]